MTFVLSVDLDRLQNDRLKLVPLDACSQSQFEELATEINISHRELWHYFPMGPFASIESYKNWYDQNMKSNPAHQIFAIYLKAGTVTKRQPGSGKIETFKVENDTLAGTTGLVYAEPQKSKVEMGCVMVLPRFQRTFVNTHANCLLLKHLLEPVACGDLGMRRVQWQANSHNKASIVTAQRLGMTLEGIMRWARVIGDHKDCVSEAEGERKDGLPVVDSLGNSIGPGRHDAILSLCWDDWLDGKREHVLGLLNS